MNEPLSLLTKERPDIWLRAVALAVSVTGYEYVPKLPLPDGSLSSCGGGYYIPPREPTLRERIEERKRLIRDRASRVPPVDTTDMEAELAQLEEELLREESKLYMPVPEGAMEWLLHEVGHWVAATPEERLLPNYGYDDSVLQNGLGAAREWQAWGFEDLILGPFGNTRMFAPRSQWEGVAFEDKGGPIPSWAVRHADLHMRALGMDVTQWRALYGEWSRWLGGSQR